MTKKLNRIKCAKCNTICTSRYRHDFVTCDCGVVSVDGGQDYCRYVGELENILVFKNRKWVQVKFDNEQPRKIQKDGVWEQEELGITNTSIFKTAFDCTMAPYKMLLDFIKRIFK